jgi:hypothetical protein
MIAAIVSSKRLTEGSSDRKTAMGLGAVIGGFFANSTVLSVTIKTVCPYLKKGI